MKDMQQLSEMRIAIHVDRSSRETKKADESHGEESGATREDKNRR